MKHALGLMLLAALTVAPGFGAKKNYDYIRVGNAADVVKQTTGGTVLMGGGTDVDAAFQWMCGLSGGGDFLVLRATGTDAYNPYIQHLCPGANSVATLIVPSRAGASDSFVVAAVEQAEAVWLAGGDQSNYLNYWKGTPLQAALQAKAGRAPLGGTSAGMNVLTQFIYSALLSQGVTSSQALADPFTKYLTLDRDFLAVAGLEGIIGDPHFVERDRMGRDLAFLCRIYANGWSTAPRGISVDVETALLVDVNGGTSVAGKGNAYFLKASSAPLTCQPKRPLTYLGVKVHRIAAGDTFDLSTWKGTGGVDYTVSADNGALSSTQAGGAIY